MIIYLLDISIILMGIFHGTSCINCFKCSSLNGSNTDCEDPFNPAMSSYIEKCMVPKRGHVGMFPANFCTKIVGTNVITREVMVIRQCAMKTMDSQCGEFKYQDNTMDGCILTCDFDGCNSGYKNTSNTILQLIFPVLILIMMTIYFNGSSQP
ncbi:U-scoloptoxin(05)-Sm1a-like isoform X2 [Daktulosphaira vitifoliae]|nr:U-scoloptoxin(05)-Sm1a-like isoform X2 [Daktulosphaira vitifoliae]XP_050531122.1 U-scoloptoxin(05)-Sm1a-like isoform X2 [Daktulosphaira vitifoliae]XP_050531123.1 U-scoloptoxin(05)-Sm1a-like isoform X2 [Daktulosphaira vitifoliae]XP_050531124.1 U-scoloptoxin(05)-Sm1a-like isoform X2 [Daktulosphaira vitifoliae]